MIPGSYALMHRESCSSLARGVQGQQRRPCDCDLGHGSCGIHGTFPCLCVGAAVPPKVAP